ncbi:inositol polyphosphate 1-phosphatase isoform X2 [Leptinotarsa decemlineata]|uniref:inositol polyphosphate 1-phosphatase isoform X2 n=1 Tax=Leptinotarsa decemlineata TaxID=7539 RepID=UPI003D30C301
MDLLKALILASEKAANIARVCRKHEHLFDLLVQRKTKKEANPRFIDDFKTLADVLIQEMVKHDIGSQFQELSSHIKGEENNVFRNQLGQEICVEVMPSQQETSNLLEKVLNGDRIAAELLAAEVHKEIELAEINTTIPQQDFCIDLTELGVWIDPIDCTAEYIHGGSGKCDRKIHLDGLKCVTVLIGVFNRASGVPVMGVINRPFLDEVDYQYSQQCIWGVSVENFNTNSGVNMTERQNIVCVSSSEDIGIKEKLELNGFHLVEASGAGYKILAVILDVRSTVQSIHNIHISPTYGVVGGGEQNW